MAFLLALLLGASAPTVERSLRTHQPLDVTPLDVAFLDADRLFVLSDETLSLYRFDINFRESAVIGIVGAGGIGATLNTAFDRYEYDTAAAILVSIIAIVMVAEYLSGVIRRRVQ